MNDAYEFYDYGDLFPRRESSSSIRMKEESKNNTNEKYLKELKRKADEATRKSFTDKLSERMKDLNEELNTKALEEMAFFYENKPIKLKELMFNNMKKTAEAMNDSLGVKTDSNDGNIDVQSVSPSEINSSISNAFDPSNITSGNNGFEMPSGLPPVIAKEDSNFFTQGGDLVTGDVSEADASKDSPPVIPNGDSNFFTQGGDLVTGDVSEADAAKDLPPVIANGDSNFFTQGGDLVAGDVSEADASKDSPSVIPNGDSSFFTQGGDLVTGDVSEADASKDYHVTPEVKNSINGFVYEHVGPKEDSNVVEDASGLDSTQKEVDDHSSISDDKLKSDVADFLGAQSTGDGKYTFPVAVPDHISESIRGEDIQVVPDRENTSMSSEINREDTEDRESDKAVDDIPDNIFGVEPSETDSVHEASDISSTSVVEDANGDERVVDPDFGELFGYSKPGGGVDYVSFAPDIMRQFEEARNHVAKLNAEKEEKTREEAESAQSVQNLQSEIEAKVRKLFDNTKQVERKGFELRDQIDSIDQNIDSNKQTASMLSDVSSQLSDMLAEFTDVSEDEDVKGRSM